ncbi:ABC transporter substrate-binding protein [Hymenobacter psoromatis]|uniref:ABC transporter substrate-binding protein n=1 Tax=Hymenobacter psoromatis TaxID=1484116 RepID=UPI001CC0599B|nr:ABC transporter substrate-binding protein [Hymenobacter psoromatis]
MKYLSLLSSLVLVVSACQPDASVSSTEAVRIRWARDPETLDPLTQPNQNATDASYLLHLGLLQVNYQTNEYAPALAQSLPGVQVLGDSLTQLDYHLRPTAAWDNGRPVLATDVAFTLKLMHCPGLPNESAREQFGFIRQLRADPADPRHFTLVCRGQANDYQITSGDFPVLPEDILDPAHTLRDFPLSVLQDWLPKRPPAPAVAALVRRYLAAGLAKHPGHLPGCGPYRLAAWEPNRRLLFQRKAHWWADALRPVPFVLQARPRQLDYLIIPDDAAAVLALRRQEVDVYPHVPARVFERLRASEAARSELAFYTSPSYDVLTVGFNTQHAALRDKYTRQALSRLFDPVGLLAATQLGEGRRTVGLLSPTSQFYNDSLPLLTYAPTQAQSLLRLAGWQRQANGQWRQPNNPQPLALALRYRADEATFATAALQFKAAAEQLSIQVTLLPMEAAMLGQALQAGDFDLYIRLVKGNPFGLNFESMLHSRAIGSGNITGFGRPDTDHLLEAIAAEGNILRRRVLLRRFQALLRDEMPILPLFFLNNHLIVNRGLRHVVISSLKPGYAATALFWAAADSTGSHSPATP